MSETKTTTDKAPLLAADMTLRDYFAGQVAAGMMALDAGPCQGATEDARDKERRDYIAAVAAAAYRLADAMLAAREGRVNG